jgi:signal transduction histidine kinase
VLDELEVRAQVAGVRLTRQVGAPRVLADPELLRRVLENLVENAIRYAPEGSAVEVAARLADGGVEVAVADGGAGVPVAARAQVFERFVQAGGDTTRTNRGLGLAFCKLAVEAHGGRIWIEDAAPGARFCVWIDHAD